MSDYTRLLKLGAGLMAVLGLLGLGSLVLLLVYTDEPTGPLAAVLVALLINLIWSGIMLASLRMTRSHGPMNLSFQLGFHKAWLTTSLLLLLFSALIARTGSAALLASLAFAVLGSACGIAWVIFLAKRKSSLTALR